MGQQPSPGDEGEGANPNQTAQATVCPRPNPVPGAAGFGGQESSVRELRRRAFAGDFFSQIELGRRYEGGRSVDKKIGDPVEAAVWFAVALANTEGWNGLDRPVVEGGARTYPREQCLLCRILGFPQIAPPPLPFSCRDREREDAYARLESLAANLTGPDREKVRDRVIYLLSTQGGRGFATLSRMYDRSYATFGEPWTDIVASNANNPNTNAIFVRSDADAWLYNYLAAGTGDISGYVALHQFEVNHPDMRDALTAAANRWTPPYEFYPPEPPENMPGAEQYSDETRPLDGSEESSLREFVSVPFVHIGRALRFLQVTHECCAIHSPRELDPHAVSAFHALIGRPTSADEPFTLLDGVRAIQLAAVRGSADAQLVLAVMYSEGVGVRADYARSLKWFEAAAHQGSPAAQFAVSSYFALGVEGVADQDKAAAVAARLTSAVDGFHPSGSRMRDLLAHICRNHHVDKSERYPGHG